MSERRAQHSNDAACRVAVCDDVAAFRELLLTIFQTTADITVVGEAANGLEAVALAQETQPDVMVLDLAMPLMDGFAALPLIREAAPECKVVVLSGFSGEVRERALSLGAYSYLEKGALPRAIVEAVRAAYAG